MNGQVPIIYSPRFVGGRVSVWGRLLALAIGLACLTVLGIAAKLRPNPSGTGTHEGLGLAECQFLYRTGLPCPSCGYTTSFAWFARGNIVASLYVQPMGTLLAAICAAGVWVGFYIAVSGRAVHRVLRGFEPGTWIIGLMVLAIAAWGWKIFIHLKGIDGW